MSDPKDSLRALDAEFELGEALGRGAMGSVYRARERASGREVALKILHAETSSAASRFLREGQVTAALQHPGIVGIHSIGTIGGRPCLAYELVPGARTYEAAVSDNPLAAISFLVQAGRALGSAHALGLTHRDVKSENLLVDGEGRLRVSDFGLVTGEELSRLTQSGAWVGTPQTMSPEQFGDRAAVGPTSDVWSLGVLLYWTLTGRYPFQGAESMIALASAITAGDFPPPASIRPVSRSLEAICLRALQARPRDRYPQGDAFADALEAASRGGEAAARSGWALWVGGVALLLLAATGAWVALSFERPPKSPPATIPPAPVPAAVSPRESASVTPLADPLPPGVMGWEPAPGSRLDPKTLDHRFLKVESSFEHLLFALKNGYGPESELRAARALLGGVGVARDVEPALAILRHGARCGRRAAQVFLIETLAEEGLLDEELVWIGRLAQGHPRPFEVHRLWKIARRNEARSPAAQAIWRAIAPERLRAAAMYSLRGRARSGLGDLRAEGQERSQFLREAMVEGWRRDPGLWADWDLSVALDAMTRAEQLGLIAHASPSRELARLCLRRKDRDLLEPAIAPTLAGAEEPWLLEVLEQLLALRVTPPSAAKILDLLQGSQSLPARRWVAVCEAQGFVLAPSTRGLKSLRQLLAAGHYAAGVMLVNGAPKEVGAAKRGAILRSGVRAGDPASLLAWSRVLLVGSPGEREVEEGVLALRRAAEAGHVQAQIGYSGWLRGRARSPEDLAEVFGYMAKAANQDSAYALEIKAIYLQAGIGCRKDPKQAERDLRHAAWLGRASAAVRYGYLWLGAVPGEEKHERVNRLDKAHDYFLRAVRQSGSLEARLGLALCRLEMPRRAQEGFQALAQLAEEAPTSKAATEYGRRLLAGGELDAGERVLERAATHRTDAFAALLARWRSSDRADLADRMLAAGVVAKQPSALILAARERFARERSWAVATLRELGQSRPEALSVLGELIWEEGGARRRDLAYRLWLNAESRDDESARAALVKHGLPERGRAIRPR